MQILVTIGSGVLGERGVEFHTFPLTCVVLKTLWRYRASVWWWLIKFHSNCHCGHLKWEKGADKREGMGTFLPILCGYILWAQVYRTEPISI